MKPCITIPQHIRPKSDYSPGINEKIWRIPCWPPWCHNELGPGTEHTQCWIWIHWKTCWTGSICIKASLICSCGKQCPSLLNMPSSMLIPARQKWEQSCDIKSSKVSLHNAERGPVNDTTGWLVVLRVEEDGVLETAIVETVIRKRYIWVKEIIFLKYLVVCTGIYGRKWVILWLCYAIF